MAHDVYQKFGDALAEFVRSYVNNKDSKSRTWEATCIVYEWRKSDVQMIVLTLNIGWSYSSRLAADMAVRLETLTFLGWYVARYKNRNLFILNGKASSDRRS